MRQIVLGIVTVVVFTTVLTVFVIGLAFYQDYSTRKYVNQYYDDMIKEDYEGAYKHLHLWAGNPDQPLAASPTAAKQAFLKKVSALKKQEYRIVSVDDIVVTEEGSHLGARVKLTVNIKGQSRRLQEHLNFYETKIVITDSQDPFARYRDGQLTF